MPVGSLGILHSSHDASYFSLHVSQTTLGWFHSGSSRRGGGGRQQNEHPNQYLKFAQISQFQDANILLARRKGGWMGGGGGAPCAAAPWIRPLDPPQLR